MQILERKIPNKLIVLEALLKRLPENDQEYQYFKDLHIQAKKGYEGELRVDREWCEMVIPSNYYLFHNFETINEVNHSHQIDTVFASTKFVLLLEIKNIGGRIDFNQKKHQFMRTRFDGTKEGFSNPIDQIERHVRFFKRLLLKWDVLLPIEYAIVLTKPSTIIGEIPRHIPIFHVSGLQTYVYRLFNKYREYQVLTHQLELLKTNLLAIRKAKIWEPNIDRRKLRKGALCKNCNYKFVMKFEHGQFLCPICKEKGKKEFFEALYDYRYLYNEWITNNEIREYLKIDSRFAANRLVTNLNLEFKGAKRNRKYRIPENILSLYKNRT